MDTQQIVLDLERRARACGLTIREVCDRAGIYQSTWTRWKAGKNPANLGPLNRVIAVIEDAERARAA